MRMPVVHSEGAVFFLSILFSLFVFSVVIASYFFSFPFLPFTLLVALLA
jgi:hypothetical protein